ncbi:MAG TPA: hypothetical protein VFR78_23755 [Pyrinomonadaceae bacterium]|nr:hypothetical protein [Pyrinomonadaceae bacterium]
MLNNPAQRPHAFTASLRRVELGDILLLLYITAFVRQYFWLVTNNTVAWALTILVTLPIWYFFLTTKPTGPAKSKLFWPIVALPLFIIYAMRVAFPDGSFDQLNYHLLSGERALRGVPFTAADFFPAPIQFNPAPQIVTGITRYILGYRLGTIINYAVMLWAGSILYRLLSGYITNEWLRCFGVLLILLTEQPLFEINNYMTDLLAVPLLLDVTLVVLNTKGIDRRELIRVAFFLGAATAIKLINLAFVLPLLLVYAYKLDAHKLAFKLKDAAAFVLVFLAPLVPFSLFMYVKTGSPVFPFYNTIFRSPYWPLINWTDVRWGPKGIVQGLLWPFFIAFEPERGSELPVSSGRLAFIFLVVILCFFLRPTARTRTLCIILLLSFALWTITTGYGRYAVFLELLGAAAILAAVYELARIKGALRSAVIVSAWIVLMFQSALSVAYVYRYEWSMRPTIFHDPQSFFAESRHILRDHSFAKFVPERERQLFANVDVWIESNFITNGLETLTKPDAPILLVCFPYYFEAPASVEKFNNTLNNAAGKKIYTLAFTKDLSPSLDLLSFRGLEMGKFTAVSVPFYSDRYRYDMVLVEIAPGKGTRRENIRTTTATSPLPVSGFNAELTVSNSPTIVKAGARELVYVKIKNTSDTTWNALGQPDSKFAIKLGNHWLDERGAMVVQDDARASLLFDLAPGQEVELPLTVTAPREPGRYILEIDMVQELVAWFGSAGSKTLRMEVKAEP